MLIELSITNYRSFRDLQRFSMVSAADRQLLESNTMAIPTLGKMRLNRSAVVYGANASGKSNLFMALMFLQSLMLDAVRSAPAVGQRALDTHLLRPFLLDDTSPSRPISLELSFIHNTVRYQYGLLLTRERILEEWLIAYPRNQPQRWFGRTYKVEQTILPTPGVLHESGVIYAVTDQDEQDEQEYDPTDHSIELPLADNAKSDEYDWYFGPRLQGEKQRLADLTRADVPFLAVAATFGSPQLREVYNWFTAKLSIINAESAEIVMEELTARQMMRNAHLHNRVQILLKEADTGIQGLSVRRVPSNNSSDVALTDGGKKQERRTEIIMRHDAPDTINGYVDLPQQDESRGTRRLVEIAGPILTALERGNILIIDELDESLHPVLVRRLIELFHDTTTNPHGAQLIMNTHDATLLDTSLFRRDQIWFTEKDRVGISTLIPLSDFSPRKQEALVRGYLAGRYGGLPFIEDLRTSMKSSAADQPSSRTAQKSYGEDAKAT